MSHPPKKWQFWVGKELLTTMAVGGTALVLYLAMTLLSGIFWTNAKTELITKRNNNEHCKDSKDMDVKLIGLAVRVIFWNWLMIVYLISVMVYLVYIITAFVRSYSLGRAYFFVIGIMTLLNFVPCSYIFSFGDITPTENVAYWAMLGVILIFRIIDVLTMYMFLKHIKRRKSLEENIAPPQSVVVIGSEQEVPQRPMSMVKDSPDPQTVPKRSGSQPENPFEETPQE